MENNEENEYITTAEGQQYLKGFNDGYLIAEHMPEVVKALADVKDKTPHVEGFLDGANQYEQDKELSKDADKFKSTSWEIPKDNEHDKDAEHDLERDT